MGTHARPSTLCWPDMRSSGRIEKPMRLCCRSRWNTFLRIYGLGWGYPEQTRRIELVTAGRFQLERADVGSGLEWEAFLWPTCRMVASAKMQVIDPGLMDDWLTERESAGFRSHLSASQTALTLAALLNFADFVHDLRDRALRLCDRLLRQLAEHTCDGVVSGPQAVADRYILYPHSAWTHGLLSFAAGSNVVESFSPWAVFLASSAYRSPSDLNALIQRVTSRTYHEAGWPLSPHKTDYGMLSSVAIDITRSVDAKSRHLWHATLGRGCHVFVNHPSLPRKETRSSRHTIYRKTIPSGSHTHTGRSTRSKERSTEMDGTLGGLTRAPRSASGGICPLNLRVTSCRGVSCARGGSGQRGSVCAGHPITDLSRLS